MGCIVLSTYMLKENLNSSLNRLSIVYTFIIRKLKVPQS